MFELFCIPIINKKNKEVLKVNAKEILFIDDLGINLKPARELGFHTYKFTDTDKTIFYIKNMLKI